MISPNAHVKSIQTTKNQNKPDRNVAYINIMLYRFNFALKICFNT